MAIEENPFDHILYEFSMYLQASLLRCSNQFITNLMVDSRLVHMRNLAYFFCSENEGNKKYLHYSAFINGRISKEIEHSLFTEIQRVTSNSTCHLLKGRLNGSFKQETVLFEQKVFPLIVSMISDFITELNTNISPDYESAWADAQIQKNSAEIMSMIRNYNSSQVKSMVIATTE